MKRLRKVYFFQKMYIKLAFDTKILYCSRVDLNRTKNLKNGKNQKKSEIVKNTRNLD